MSQLNPLAGLQGFVQGQDAGQNSMRLLAQMALQQQQMKQRQMELEQRANQQQQELAFRQSEADRQGSQFNQRQDLDERQFAFRQQQDAMQEQERQRQQTGWQSYLNSLADDFEAQHAGISVAPPVPPQRARTSYDEDRSQFGDGANLIPQAPTPDQVVARSMAAQIRSLGNVPPAQALPMIRQLQQSMSDRATKSKQLAALEAMKSPVAKTLADGIRGELDNSMLQVMLRDTMRQQEEFNATNPNSPMFQQNVNDVMALNPNADPSRAQAYVRARANGLVNQDRGNLSGQTRDDTLEQLRRDIDTLTKGSDWEADPDTKTLVDSLRSQYRQGVAARYGAQAPATQTDAGSGQYDLGEGVKISGSVAEQVKAEVAAWAKANAIGDPALINAKGREVAKRLMSQGKPQSR